MPDHLVPAGGEAITGSRQRESFIVPRDPGLHQMGPMAGTVGEASIRREGIQVGTGVVIGHNEDLRWLGTQCYPHRAR